MLVFLVPFGTFFSHFVHFVAIWYILWWFGTFSPIWVCWTKKNLAILDKCILSNRI
jgi:hypothetical protein